MVKWMSRVAGNRGRSLIPSTVITLAIVAMLIFSGPAQAVAVVISGLQDSYTKGNDIDFQVKIELNDPDKYVPITNLSLNFTGPVNNTIIFDLDGKRISGNCNVEIEPVSVPKPDDFGYGSGYGYDNRTGNSNNFGYGYGYGYGYGGGGGKLTFIYNVTIETGTTCFPAGDYSVVATLNTDKNVAFQSQTFGFKLLPVAPGEKIKAKVDIKPETINLASKGKFTAFITLPDGFDVKDINVGTVVVEGAHVVKSMISEKDGGTLIAKFNTQDLKNVQTGKVTFTVTGKVSGMDFEGSDTLKVIDNGKEKDDKDCECDEHVDEDEHGDHVGEHDDECDEHEEDHEHKKINDNKPDKNKQKKNGQGYNVVNNININNNSGTVNVYVNNQGNGNKVNQGNRGGNGKGRK